MKKRISKKEMRAFARGLGALYSAAFLATAVNEAERLSEKGQLKNSAIWGQIVSEMKKIEPPPHDAHYKWKGPGRDR